MVTYKDLTELKPCECAFLLLNDEENARFELLIYKKEAILLLFNTFIEKEGTSYALVASLMEDLAAILKDFDTLFHYTLNHYFTPEETAFILNKGMFETTVDPIEKVFMIAKI